jgi:hypothetical protein
MYVVLLSMTAGTDLDLGTLHYAPARVTIPKIKVAMRFKTSSIAVIYIHSALGAPVGVW